MGLMFQPLMRYFDFNGRARRSEYWLWALFLFVVNVILTILQFSAMGHTVTAMSSATTGAQAMHAGNGMMMISSIKLIFFLAVLIPSIAVAVRRMHDTNRTGWWILFPTVVTIVATVIVFSVSGPSMAANFQKLGGLSGNGDPSAVLAVLSGLIMPLRWIILPSLLAKLVTFVFRVLDGTPGANRFGPDPKGRGASTSRVF